MSGDRNTERSQPIEEASQQTDLSREVSDSQMQRREEVTRNINNSSSVRELNGGASPARQNVLPEGIVREGGTIEFQVGTDFDGTTRQGIRLGYNSGNTGVYIRTTSETERDPDNNTITHRRTNAVGIRVGQKN